MIDLAPHHKHGLVVKSPVLLAGGVCGGGDTLPWGINPTLLGAVVVGPLTQRSRAGAAPPRLAEFPGGFVLDTGTQNRGVEAALRRYGRLWPRLGCPVIIQLADNQPQALTSVAETLITIEGVQGFELLLPRRADEERTKRLTTALTRASDRPVWVKLPLEEAVALAPAAVEAGAVGLVVAQSPLGRVRRIDRDSQPHWITGSVYSPAIFVQALAALAAVARLKLPATLIAAGGVHNFDQIEQALSAGAQAVQIDSLAWSAPELLRRIAERAAFGGWENAH